MKAFLRACLLIKNRFDVSVGISSCIPSRGQGSTCSRSLTWILNERYAQRNRILECNPSPPQQTTQEDQRADLERKLLNLNKSLLNGIIDQQDYNEQKADIHAQMKPVVGCIQGCGRPRRPATGSPRPATGSPRRLSTSHSTPSPRPFTASMTPRQHFQASAPRQLQTALSLETLQHLTRGSQISGAAAATPRYATSRQEGRPKVNSARE